jgi:hypothetical protein
MDPYKIACVMMDLRSCARPVLQNVQVSHSFLACTESVLWVELDNFLDVE